jgi:hypothetical protein
LSFAKFSVTDIPTLLSYPCRRRYAASPGQSNGVHCDARRRVGSEK